MSLKKMMWASLVSSAVMLCGCGNDYDGSYRAMDGIIGPVIVLVVDGSVARATKIDPFRKLVLSEETFSAKDKGEKLLLTNGKDKTFAFARAVDEKNLDCLNCGWGSGLPNSWQYFAPKQ